MSSSRYWELTVEIPEEASEGLTNFVWELGALGVVEEELPGRRPRVRAFFPKTLVARALEESVREYLGGLRRSEEHTSELQSLAYLVCRLLLEKKKKKDRKE